MRKGLGLHYKPFCRFGWWKPVSFLRNPPGAPAKIFKTPPSIESWASLTPSAEEATEDQLLLGALVRVQVAPELLEV